MQVSYTPNPFESVSSDRLGKLLQAQACAVPVRTGHFVDIKHTVPSSMANVSASVVTAGKAHDQIQELVIESARLEKERDALADDLRALRSGIAQVMQANQTLRKLVLAKNSDALDVMGVFSGFRIPKEVTDLSSVDVADSIRTRITDSVYRNSVRDFVSFVTRSGYTLSKGDENGISTVDIFSIIKGVRAARYLKEKQGIKSLVAAIKEANYAEDRVQELSKSVADLETKRAELARETVPVQTQTKSLVSEIGKRQEQLRDATRDQSRMQSEITDLNAQLSALKDLKSMPQQDVMAKALEIERSIKKLRQDYDALAAQYNIAKRSTKAFRDQKALLLQEQSLQRKKAEKLNQLQGKYARYPKPEQDKLVAKEIRAWEKVQREHLAERNQEAGRGQDQSQTLLDKDKIAKDMDELLKQIDNLDVKLSIVRSAAKQTLEERTGRIGKMTDLMAQKKAELKNQAKKIARREAGVRNETDAKAIREQVEYKLESDEKFLASARKHHPVRALMLSLEFGVSQKTKAMMDVAWSYFKRGLRFKVTKTLGRRTNTANKHFGSKGFVVDPRYPNINAELVTVLNAALGELYKTLKPTDLVDVVVSGVLDGAATANGMQEHKAAYTHWVRAVYKQLHAKKTRLLLEELIENLIEDKKIVVTERATAKFVVNMVDSFVGVIANARAVEKLAAFAWPGYREDMLDWVRNQFKTTTKIKTKTK